MGLVPKGPTGLRSILVSLPLLSDPRMVLRSAGKAYGPIWRMSMPAEERLLTPLTFLLGPSGNERILSPAYREDFSWYEGYRFTMEPMFGRDILFLLDDEAHKERHRVLLPAFHPRMDDAYEGAMREMIQARIATWPRYGVLDLMEEIKQVTFQIVANLLFSVPKDDLPVLYHHFEALGLGLFSVVRVNLPGFRFHKGLRARRWLANYLLSQIQEQQAKPKRKTGTVLAALLGASLSEESITSELLAFLFAGYDTTSSMLTSFFSCVLDRKELCTTLAKEVRNEVPQSPWMQASLLETERLHPPLTFALRGVRRDLEFQGYEIPKGSKVAYSAYYTGRMESLFPQADQFLPERFLSTTKREQGLARPSPYTVLGFGGGHRACIGKRFALLEMTILCQEILRHCELRKVPGQSEEVYFNPTMQRRHGLLVEVRSQ